MSGITCIRLFVRGKAVKEIILREGMKELLPFKGNLSTGCNRREITEFPRIINWITLIAHFLYNNCMLPEGAVSRSAASSTYPGNVAHLGHPTRCKQGQSDGRQRPWGPAGSGGLWSHPSLLQSAARKTNILLFYGQQQIMNCFVRKEQQDRFIFDNYIQHNI